MTGYKPQGQTEMLPAEGPSSVEGLGGAVEARVGCGDDGQHLNHAPSSSNTPLEIPPAQVMEELLPDRAQWLWAARLLDTGEPGWTLA